VDVRAEGVTGIWALFDPQPAWIFTFPHNTNDAIFHLATGVVFAAVAAIQVVSKPAGPGRPQA
jgi:hypothetical protein